MPGAHDVLARRLRWQSRGCAGLGSPFYAQLLESAALDVEAAGPAWDLLEGFVREPAESAIALRLMAVVHRHVFEGRLPELAVHYPSAGGDGDAQAAWPWFLKALVENRELYRGLLTGGCQTNEVGRCAALLGGFLEVAHRTHRPLRILEVGASGGLNLNWDRYRYESSAGAWGDARSPVRFDHSFEVPPEMDRAALVVERRGCDLNPIDPSSIEGALTLRSFVWADQLSRLALLDGAIEVARDAPVEVAKAGAADFLESELARPRPAVATVVYHSVFLQYVAAQEQERMRHAIDEAGVFHLAMEPNYPLFEVRLNGELLGTSFAHGSGVRWNVDSTPQ